MNSNIKEYTEKEKMNLNLIIALRRSVQPEDKSLSALISDYGITISQFGVLDALYHLGDLNINQILDKTLSTSGNMTVVIKNLVKLGLVTKKRDPEDGRAFLIQITEKGHQIMEELFPKHLNDLDEIFSTLNDDDKECLLRLLKKLNRYGK